MVNETPITVIVVDTDDCWICRSEIGLPIELRSTPTPLCEEHKSTTIVRIYRPDDETEGAPFVDLPSVFVEEVEGR